MPGVAEFERATAQLPHRRRPGPGPSGDAACYVGSGRRRLRWPCKVANFDNRRISVKVEAEKTLTEN